MHMLALLLVLVGSGIGQAPQDTLPAAAGAPVILRGDTIWVVRAPFGPFTPQERAAAALTRLRRLARDPAASHDSLRIFDDGTTTSVLLGDVVVLTITEADAAAEGASRAALAERMVPVIRHLLEQESVWGIVRIVATGLLKALLATAVLLLALMLLNRFVPVAMDRLDRWCGSRIPTLRIQRLELLSASRLTDLFKAAVRLGRFVIVVVLLFWYISLVFSFFPWTARVAERLFDYVVTPLQHVGSATLAYVPNIFYIGVILTATHYGLRFIKLFFDGLGSGTLQIRGFYREWAAPTFNIVKFLVFAFALVVIFPYLPGSGSDAFKGVSVFFGVLLSLGSAGAIGNVMAGIVITYMRPFGLGDRVKIADTVGDVIERSLLVTRIRTPKHVEVSVPNAMVLSSHIINYSWAAQDGGVILNTKLTIGYDTPWRQVHELLLAAAAKTGGLLAEPAPFVLQTALSDFYVEYELNAYTEQPNQMATIYSDLHQNIQDAFQEAGVQIMSPNYEMDPSEPKIPPAYPPASGRPGKER